MSDLDYSDDNDSDGSDVNDRMKSPMASLDSLSECGVNIRECV